MKQSRPVCVTGTLEPSCEASYGRNCGPAAAENVCIPRKGLNLFKRILLSVFLLAGIVWSAAHAFEIMQPLVYEKGMDVSG